MRRWLINTTLLALVVLVIALCQGRTGRELSSGYVWVADSSGNIVKIDQSSGAFVKAIPVGVPDTIGVAIDFEGYVWAVSQGANAAYKIDPQTETFVTVPIGAGPYTYSDMTGVQLQNVTVPE